MNIHNQTSDVCDNGVTDVGVCPVAGVCLYNICLLPALVAYTCGLQYKLQSVSGR